MHRNASAKINEVIMQLKQVCLSLTVMAILAGWLVASQLAGAAQPTGGSGPNQVLLAAA
jgi:hypothetical protein